MGNKYERKYYSFTFHSADQEIEWVHKRPGDLYPQTRKTFIEIIENSKNNNLPFYLKFEKNGFYGNKTAWWVYSGETFINIDHYKNYGNILCFPSEAEKELS